jgi:hypothetical protein
MKKSILILFIVFLCINTFAQSETIQIETIKVEVDNNTNVVQPLLKPKPDFGLLIKFKPFYTIAGFFLGGFDFGLAVVPYVTPNVGIPIDVEFAAINGIVGVVLMSGIEAVPLRHREKSGLYLNYQLGGMFYNTGDTGFCTMGNVGYQLVSKRGFVFAAAAGIRYDTLTQRIAPNFMLDFGFALRKR